MKMLLKETLNHFFFKFQSDLMNKSLFQDWLAFAKGGDTFRFQGKLKFKNNGAPLEEDNFAFCKVKLFH